MSEGRSEIQPPVEVEPDAPDAPAWMTHEAAYGWSCGWSAGYRTAISGRGDER